MDSLYKDMLRIRLIEEAIAERYPYQEMRCPVHLSIGQEACAVGVMAALEKGDYAMSGHRAHAHYLAKGGSLKKMLAEIFGKASGCSKGKGGSMHLIAPEVNYLGSTPIVGGSLPVAVGHAFASKMQEENRITTAFFGDAATEEGVFSECLNFAALKKLPVLFICENNLYSVQSPLSVRQAERRDLVAIALAHGVLGVRGNGMNVRGVLDIAKEAVDSIRSGRGPALIELATYRFLEHCGPSEDADIGYRTQDEIDLWRSRCPIQQIEKEEGIDSSHLRQQIMQEIEEAFTFAKQSDYPDECNLTKDIYSYA